MNAEKEDAKAKDDARRGFLKKAAKVSVTTPAVVMLLLSAGTKRSQAGDLYM